MKKEAEFFHYEKCDTTTFEVLMLDKRTNRQQPSPLLYSIDIWPARNSRLTQHSVKRITIWLVAQACYPGPTLLDACPNN